MTAIFHKYISNRILDIANLRITVKLLTMLLYDFHNIIKNKCIIYLI